MRLDSSSSRTLRPVDHFFLFSSILFQNIFHLLFSVEFFIIECKLSYSIDKIHPLSQVHVILLITVQWYTVTKFFDNFGATWSHMLGLRSILWYYTSPLPSIALLRPVSPFSFTEWFRRFLCFCVPYVLVLLQYEQIETGVLCECMWKQFTYKCNGELLYLGILNHYYLSSLVNQRRNWINKTRCITVVRRDIQKCCTEQNQTKLKRIYVLTYITSTGHIRKVI